MTKIQYTSPGLGYLDTRYLRLDCANDPLTEPLQISKTITDSDSGSFHNLLNITGTNAATSKNLRGVYAELHSSGTTSGTMTGGDFRVYHDVGAVLSSMNGLNGFANAYAPLTELYGLNFSANASSTANKIYGMQVVARSSYAGTNPVIYGALLEVGSSGSSAVITDTYGVKLTVDAAGTLTNFYGLYIPTTANITNRYSIYSLMGNAYIQNDVTTNPNLTLQAVASQTGAFLKLNNSSGTPLSVLDANGYLGIGTASPLQKIHLKQTGGDNGIVFDQDQTPTNTANTLVGTGASDGSNGGSRSWTNPTRIVAGDGLYAYASLVSSSTDLSYYLVGTNCSFALSANAVVTGIKVTINKWQSSSSGAISDDAIYLWNSGVIAGGSNKADAVTVWPTDTSNVITYGGAGDMWGLTTTELNPTTINSSTFGVCMSARNANTTSSFARVNYYTITIYYNDGVDREWVIGNDYSNNGSWNISRSTTIGTNNVLVIDTTSGISLLEEVTATNNILIDSDSYGLKLGADQDLLLYSDGAGVLYIKPTVADTDTTVNFFGTTNSGQLKWMEDEDYFQFTDKVLLDDKLMFTQVDGNEYIDSLNDGYLDYGATTGHRLLIGGTEQINLIDGVLEPTTTNDIDLGTSSLLYKDIWETGKHYFRDSAIYAWSSGDGWMNLVADTGVEINAPILNGTKLVMQEAEIGDDASNYTDIDTDGVISFNGLAGIVLPHLMQSDNTDQTIADDTEEQIITFDTDVHHNGITRTSSSRFTITKVGSYLLTFSAVALSGTAGKKLAIWMKKNGTNVDSSTTYYTFKSANANAVITVTFLYHFAVNDYFEFWMYGNDESIKLDYTAAVADSPGVTPAIPACPSIIMTCNYVGKD